MNYKKVIILFEIIFPVVKLKIKNKIKLFKNNYDTFNKSNKTKRNYKTRMKI